MNRAYQPQQGSVAWKVIQFLTTNPDEKLTADDVAAKFECGARNVHTLLAQAVATGVLKRAENDDGELEYSLGTGVDAIKPNASEAPSLRAVTPFVGSVAKRKKAVWSLDINAIAIEDAVPVPTGPRHQRFDWDQLFGRMQPGQSCVLPITTKASAQSAITKAHKAQKGEFTLRRVSDEEVRVWRLR